MAARTLERKNNNKDVSVYVYTNMDNFTSLHLFIWCNLVH